ncbi:MAG: hypothetical protein AB9915_00205 [Candidatus Dojkabacteria bacterium]
MSEQDTYEQGNFGDFIPTDKPFNGLLKDGTPYVVSVSLFDRSLDPESFMEGKAKSLLDSVDREDKELLILSYYDEAPDFTGEGLFPGGVTMSLWKTFDGGLVLYSLYQDYLLEAVIKKGNKIDNIETKISHNKEEYNGFTEVVHRANISMENILREWRENLKNSNLNGASTTYLKLLNWNIFPKLADSNIWSSLYRQDPLLMLTYRCFMKYIVQPTIALNNPNLRMHLNTSNRNH